MNRQTITQRIVQFDFQGSRKSSFVRAMHDALWIKHHPAPEMDWMHEDLGNFYAAIADVSPDPERIPYGACEPFGLGYKIPLRHYKEIEQEQIGEFLQLKGGDQVVDLLFNRQPKPPTTCAQLLQFTGIWRGDDLPERLQECIDNRTETDFSMEFPPAQQVNLPATPTPEGIQSLLTLIETVKCDPEILDALQVTAEDMDAAEALIRQNWGQPRPALESPWIPLEERTPAKGQKVIAYDFKADDVNTLYYTHEGFESWMGGRCTKFKDISHWMSIPDIKPIRRKGIDT